MKQLLQNTWIRNAGLIIAGLLLGWLWFGGSGTETPPQSESTHTAADHEQDTVWTCSMHPQVRQSEPGNCPICGMELIPAGSDKSSEGALSQGQIELSEAAAKLAEIETSAVVREPAVQVMDLPGKIAVDERRISSVTAHFPGRIKQLLVNYTGEFVEKGQVLARVYSPTLITAQKELLEALRYKNENPALYQAARRKLELWELPEDQIRSIEKQEEVITEVAIVSPVRGYVLKRMISREDHVKEGTVMYEIANLAKVWGIFEAYESDIAAVEVGDQIRFTVDALPGSTFEAKVSYIDPVLQADTRTVRIRTEIPNPDRRLKPEMITQATIRSELRNGQSMLQVPASAVLWTGKRSLVYVKDPNSDQPRFEAREVVLGPRVGESYVILEGLQEGESVVSHGTFKLDSAAQLAGKTSMMNRPASSSEEAGSEMQMESTETSDQRADFDSSFTSSLRTQLATYFDLKEALVADNAAEAAQQAVRLSSGLKEVAMPQNHQAHEVWMQHRKVMLTHLAQAQDTEDIEAQRKAFSMLSDALITVIKQSQMEGVGYQQHCPMAFGEGADWISQSEDVRNPYYGQQMLTCGSVVTRW
jgi:Cu(I)/Ag(I) efflux system membrane fusion protein